MNKSFLNPSLNLAIIGYGYWGKICFKTLKNIPNICIKYIVTSQKTLTTIPHSTHLLESWESLINKDDLDGVIIASPSSTHFKIAKAFINNKIPVFIEKPMTLCIKEANELLKLEKKYKQPVVVDHILLFSPAFDFEPVKISGISKLNFVFK